MRVPSPSGSHYTFREPGLVPGAILPEAGEEDGSGGVGVRPGLPADPGLADGRAGVLGLGRVSRIGGVAGRVVTRPGSLGHYPPPEGATFIEIAGGWRYRSGWHGEPDRMFRLPPSRRGWWTTLWTWTPGG